MLIFANIIQEKRIDRVNIIKEMIKHFLEKGFKINNQDTSGATAIHKTFNVISRVKTITEKKSCQDIIKFLFEQEDQEENKSLQIVKNFLKILHFTNY